MWLSKSIKKLIKAYKELGYFRVYRLEDGTLWKKGAVDQRGDWCGPYEEYYSNGQVKIQGTVKRVNRVFRDETNQYIGPYKEYYENGQPKQECVYDEQGAFDGVYKEYYANGQVERECVYKNGREVGLHREYYENGQIKTEYTYNEQGKLDGLCKEYYENGQIKIECSYKNGTKDGLRKEYYENGQVKIECMYNEGKEDGLCKEYYENGQIKIVCGYKNGIKDGLRKEYYENGQVKIECMYKKGKEYGLYKEYYENGQVKIECMYKRGKEDGLCKEYYENGQPKSESVYKNGQKIEGKEYYANGKIKSELSAVGYKEYYPSGRVRLEYTNEGKHCKEYYENGQLMRETALGMSEKAYYPNGQVAMADGVENHYYANGNLWYQKQDGGVIALYDQLGNAVPKEDWRITIVEFERVVTDEDDISLIPMAWKNVTTIYVKDGYERKHGYCLVYYGNQLYNYTFYKDGLEAVDPTKSNPWHLKDNEPIELLSKQPHTAPGIYPEEIAYYQGKPAMEKNQQPTGPCLVCPYRPKKDPTEKSPKVIE